MFTCLVSRGLLLLVLRAVLLNSWNNSLFLLSLVDNLFSGAFKYSTCLPCVLLSRALHKSAHACVRVVWLVSVCQHPGTLGPACCDLWDCAAFPGLSECVMLGCLNVFFYGWIPMKLAIFSKKKGGEAGKEMGQDERMMLGFVPDWLRSANL